MLKYLVDSTIQIITAMILMGMILAYIRVAYGEKAGKIMIFVTGFGFAAAIAMAVMKTMTSKIDTGTWNLWFFNVSLGLFILFLIFTAIGKHLGKLLKILSVICLGGIMVVQMVYGLADFFVYPNTIMLTEDSLLSTAFLTKMSGVLLGLVFCIVVACAANAVLKALKRREALAFLIIALLVTSVKQLASTFNYLLTRRIIGSNHTMFVFTKFVTNHSNLFIYITLGILVVIALILLVRSMHVNEAYSNPAQHRKIIHKWRMIRRWSWTAIICAAIAVFLMTVIYGIANKEVELSPIEECEVKDDALYIPFEQVNDGHLHRFGYETEDGTVIRVIIIQKPNSSAYGIGLDACDICGETGYYEKDGMVVCNLCDVVMNINTIGFKGGCNPLVIDYSIENGHIIIPVEGLLEYEAEFK